MTVDYPPELVDSFTRLAEAVGRAASVADTYDVLCRGAVEVVDGCDHASLMLLADGRGRTAAASDDVARGGDAIEQAKPYHAWQGVFRQVLGLDPWPEDPATRRAHEPRHHHRAHARRPHRQRHRGPRGGDLRGDLDPHGRPAG